VEPSSNRPSLASSVVGRLLHGRGPRVVLVHGFTQTSRSFDRLAGALSVHREVVCVDLPGHGLSARQAVADLDEAGALLGETGGKATYVGYSLGGRTCLALALARPELVERLVVVGASAGIADETERARRKASDDALADEIEAGGPEGLARFLERWLSGPLFAHLTPEQANLPARAWNTPEGLAASLRSCGTGAQRSYWDRLGELSMPVLVVAGERDERYSRIGEELARRIGSNAELVVVPGAGHAVPFEAPEQFLALLEAFLRSRADTS
jgi:2-succinyl-6-hydroxy-2,4-cyclohexadiene-1-carboxylate synthase